MSDNQHADLVAFITTERVKARQEAFEVAAALAEDRHTYWNRTEGHGVSCDVTACEDIARAIRALK
jgi:hypothetical protein